MNQRHPKCLSSRGIYQSALWTGIWLGSFTFIGCGTKDTVQDTRTPTLANPPGSGTDTNTRSADGSPKSSSDQQKNKGASTGIKGDNPNTQNQQADNKNGNATPGVPPSENPTSNQTTPGPGPTPNPTPSNPGPGGSSTPESLFTSQVLPSFRALCVSCHADPRQPAEVRAPLTIYSYASMKVLLDMGGGPEDNRLWNRVRNLESHTGGDRCQQGNTQSPCKEMVQWWIAEKGAPPPGSAQLGRITEITALGRVYGYAFDSQNTAAAVQVNFYVDGPKGTGVAAGSTLANKPGDDGNQAGDHAFSLDLPEAFRNGKPREIFAYALIGTEERPLSTVGTKYTAYAFSQAGRDFYGANVQPRMGGCGGCHTISYEQQFYSMIAPSPAKGGTATNNQLVNKPAQTNGAAHGGGQSCANANASPCADFQRWWQVEFGTP